MEGEDSGINVGHYPLSLFSYSRVVLSPCVLCSPVCCSLGVVEGVSRRSREAAVTVPFMAVGGDSRTKESCRAVRGGSGLGARGRARLSPVSVQVLLTGCLAGLRGLTWTGS